MYKHNNLYRAIAAALVFYAMGSAAQQSSQNNEQNNQGVAEDKLENVLVTGSRILRKNNADSAVPLQVLSSEDFFEVGSLDLAEALAEIPGVSEVLTGRNSNNLIQSAGLSTVNLRRLGDDRTLVLLNGKRAVSNSGNSDRVSLSTIPSGLIERTEVTTGGASAVYGSDAIAGVVNVLIEDDYEGFQFYARNALPEASGGDELRLDFKWGTQYADGKGYFMLSGEFNERDLVRADRTRPKSIAAIEFDDPSTAANNSFANEINQPGCDPANEDRHCFLPSFSQSTPGGVFEGGDAWFKDGQWFNDQSAQPADRTGTQDFFSDFDGYNFREGWGLIGDRDIRNIGAYTQFEFDAGIRASVLALHNSVDTFTAGGFETLNDDDSFGPDQEREVGNISADNPYIPAEVEETRIGTVSFDRRLVELGEQLRINKRDTTRIISDLKGQFDSGFAWELFATYGHYSHDNMATNEQNFLRAQQALNVEVDGNGVIQCADAEARAQGCAPLNIFGEGSISPAAADYIRYTGSFSQTRDQYTFGGYLSGDLFTFRGHDVKAVFGLEFRREEQETTGDPDGDPVGGLDGDPSTDDVEVTSVATVANLKADYDVREAYTELDIPLSDTVSLQLAGRVGDYSTVGTILSWNLGGVWQPYEDLKFRTQYSRAQRAPNLTEFFSPPRPDSDSLQDPCDELLPDGTGVDQPVGAGGENADLSVVSRNCLAEAGIQAFFANPENVDEPFDGAGVVQGPNAGNQNLKEETANSYTLGVVYQPEAIPGFTVILDYYNIEVSDAISQVSTQNTVDQCYSSANYPNNKFCDVITRSPTNGSVIEVINFQENLEKEEVEGFDMSVAWKFEAPKVPGRWDLDLRYSHYITDEASFIGIGDVELTSTSLGEINTAEDEFRGSLGYTHNGWRVRYTMVYEQGGIDDIEGHPKPTDDRYFKVGSELFHRVYFAYNFGSDIRYRVFGGIDNIEDNHGPLLPTGLNRGSSRNIVSDLNDVDGRTYYMGVRIRI